MIVNFPSVYLTFLKNMVNITAKSTIFQELPFPLFKIFYTLILHYVVNFVFSTGKQLYREAINFVSYMYIHLV